jgi:hypothetical protein
MEELRPDAFASDLTKDELDSVDERVIAPTEPLDDRDSGNPEFQVEEELSCSNTGFGEYDPAL